MIFTLAGEKRTLFHLQIWTKYSAKWLGLCKWYKNLSPAKQSGKAINTIAAWDTWSTIVLLTVEIWNY